MSGNNSLTMFALILYSRLVIFFFFFLDQPRNVNKNCCTFTGSPHFCLQQLTFRLLSQVSINRFFVTSPSDKKQKRG